MIAAQVGDLTSHTTKYTSPALTQKVFANMRRVGKGFFGVNTPLFEGMLVQQQTANDVDDVVAKNVPTDDVADVVADDDIADDVANVIAHADAEPTPPSPTPTTTPPPPQELLFISQVTPTSPLSPITQPSSPPPQQQPSHDAAISMDLLNTLLETCTTLTRKVEALEQDKIAQALEITKLKQRVMRLEKKRKLRVSGLKRLKKVGTAQRVESSTDTVMDDQEDASKQRGIIAEIDANKDVTLEEVDAAKDAKVAEDADVQGRIKRSQAQVHHIDLEHADKVLKVVTATATTITAPPSAARRRKGVVIKDPEETATPSTIEGKKDNVVLRYQALKRKPQTEAQARKNMIVSLKNMAGFKMDFFKGMSYDNIRPIFEKYFNSNVAFLEKSKKELEEEASRALKRKTKSSKEKAAKKQKSDEEVEKLRKHLQIVLNDEDDVYTEATPLALKVPVVDYKIHIEYNKPYYKIIRADGTHQLFLSFLSLLRNFNREDLKMLCSSLEESKRHSWFSKSQKLEIVRVLWSSYHNIRYYTDDLASKEKISIDKIHFRSDAQQYFKEYTLRDYYCWLKTYCC
nr:hypothetical protein [Tanacetum cinerariifolium]